MQAAKAAQAAAQKQRLDERKQRDKESREREKNEKKIQKDLEKTAQTKICELETRNRELEAQSRERAQKEKESPNDFMETPEFAKWMMAKMEKEESEKLKQLEAFHSKELVLMDRLFEERKPAMEVVKQFLSAIIWTALSGCWEAFGADLGIPHNLGAP